MKLCVRNINKSYKTNTAKIQVLEDVCLDVMEGEIVCILGPSGCGKSTLLRLIAGFESADSGSVTVEGKTVTKPDTSRWMVFQDFNQLFPWKSVLENVIYPLKLRESKNKTGSSREEQRANCLRYLETVGLLEFKDSYPHQLSGGMKQKAVLARALALGAQVFLMDEPFGSLDAITRTSMQKMLLDIWSKTGVTLLFVTHDIHEAILLANRIVVMGKNPGRIKSIINNINQGPQALKINNFTEMYNRIYEELGL